IIELINLFYNFLQNGNKERLIRDEENRNFSLLNADIIQVQNSVDARFLMSFFPGKKVCIIPNGIGDDRFDVFQSIKREYSYPLLAPKIAFVGTFDFRKGAIDFLYIVKKIKQKFPTVKFKFLGTKGLFQTEKEVVNFFPRSLRGNIEVYPNFDPDELPSLLSDCQLGLFPSYL